jgi:hypothetical protein
VVLGAHNRAMSTADKIQRDERVTQLARILHRYIRTARARGLPDDGLDVIAAGRFGLQLEWNGARYLVTVQELSTPTVGARRPRSAGPGLSPQSQSALSGIGADDCERRGGAGPAVASSAGAGPTQSSIDEVRGFNRSARAAGG